MGKITVAYNGIVRHISTPCKIAAGGDALQSRKSLIDCTAIWDTGAPTTTVSQEVAERLKLTPYDKISVNTIGGAREYNLCKVDIHLPTQQTIHYVKVLVGNLSNCDLLIGMDIITLGDFAISTTDGKTTFHFRTPSKGIPGYTTTVVKEPSPFAKWLAKKILKSSSIAYTDDLPNGKLINDNEI